MPIVARASRSLYYLLLFWAIVSFAWWPHPAQARDIRPTIFKKLTDESTLVCRGEIAQVRELPLEEGLSFDLESSFKTVKSLRGACPDDIAVAWSRFNRPQMEKVGSQWYLFLKKTQDGKISLSSMDHGAWEIEILEVIDWERTRKEIVSPDSYAGVRELPDELFVWGQFKIRYFSNLHVDFGARVLDTKNFEALIKAMAGGQP
jgi:hypothetical protein